MEDRGMRVQLWTQADPWRRGTTRLNAPLAESRAQCTDCRGKLGFVENEKCWCIFSLHGREHFALLHSAQDLCPKHKGEKTCEATGCPQAAGSVVSDHAPGSDRCTWDSEFRIQFPVLSWTLTQKCTAVVCEGSGPLCEWEKMLCSVSLGVTLTCVQGSGCCSERVAAKSPGSWNRQKHENHAYDPMREK